jgi:hypothetical protein
MFLLRCRDDAKCGAKLFQANAIRLKIIDWNDILQKKATFTDEDVRATILYPVVQIYELGVI